MPNAITLCYAPQAGQACEYHLSVAADCTARQAIEHAIAQQKQAPIQPGPGSIPLAALNDWLRNCASHPQPGWALGVWGEKCTPDTTLHHGDRLELYRPLRADPKIARRERFARQGKAKSAGLFAMRRAKRFE